MHRVRAIISAPRTSINVYATPAKISAGDGVQVLTQFESAGLIIRHNRGGLFCFEMASDHHHDHMVDVDTSEVIEFIDEEIERVST